MSILIIGPSEEAAIHAAVARAREKPIPLQVAKTVEQPRAATLLLKDRRVPAMVDTVREFYPPQQVMLGTYRAAFCYEQQPAGLFRHLSVSSRNAKKVPGLEVMKMVTSAFGFGAFPPPPDRGLVWMEEFDPGHMAVNVSEIEP